MTKFIITISLLLSISFSVQADLGARLRQLKYEIKKSGTACAFLFKKVIHITKKPSKIFSSTASVDLDFMGDFYQVKVSPQDGYNRKYSILDWDHLENYPDLLGKWQKLPELAGVPIMYQLLDSYIFDGYTARYWRSKELNIHNFTKSHLLIENENSAQLVLHTPWFKNEWQSSVDLVKSLLVKYQLDHTIEQEIIPRFGSAHTPDEGPGGMARMWWDGPNSSDWSQIYWLRKLNPSNPQVQEFLKELLSY